MLRGEKWQQGHFLPRNSLKGSNDILRIKNFPTFYICFLIFIIIHQGGGAKTQIFCALRTHLWVYPMDEMKQRKKGQKI